MASNSHKTLRFNGIVFSGDGEGAKFIRLPWVRKQIKEKLGFTPFLGTLNLKIVKGNALESLKKAKATEIEPAQGYCRAKCFNAYLAGSVKCAIIRPEIVDYPIDVVEIIAPTNLREKLHLKDRDMVEVEIVS